MLERTATSASQERVKRRSLHGEGSDGAASPPIHSLAAPSLRDHQPSPLQTSLRGDHHWEKNLLAEKKSSEGEGEGRYEGVEP